VKLVKVNLAEKDFVKKYILRVFAETQKSPSVSNTKSIAVLWRCNARNH